MRALHHWAALGAPLILAGALVGPALAEVKPVAGGSVVVRIMPDPPGRQRIVRRSDREGRVSASPALERGEYAVHVVCPRDIACDLGSVRINGVELRPDAQGRRKFSVSQLFSRVRVEATIVEAEVLAQPRR